MNGAFGTIFGSFLSLFSALTGAYDFGVLDGFNMWSFLIVLYITFIVMNNIVLLNLLITVSGGADDYRAELASPAPLLRGQIMGKSHENVTETGVARWRCVPRWLKLLYHPKPCWCSP
jgi:hypothetical protein